MNYLAKMYSRNKPAVESSSKDKNPNRVSGGLKAQGGDHFTMIATQRYVQSLEEQSRKQRTSITVLERKITRCETAIEQLKSVVRNGE